MKNLLIDNYVSRGPLIKYGEHFSQFKIIRFDQSFPRYKINITLNSVKSTARNMKHKILKTTSKWLIIIMKSLVESRNALKLLESILNSSIIWLYRQYKDNVLSNVNEFTSSAGYGNIKPLLESDYSNWRCENASAETIETLRSLYK